MAIDDGKLEIYNLSGQKVQELDHITTKQVELYRMGLQPGCYIILFKNKTGDMSGVGKMMVE